MATLYFNSDQTKEIIQIAGHMGLTVMCLYVAIGKQTDPVMEDAHIARMIGATVSTVKKTRLALTKANWFKKIKTSIKGEIHIIYLVGKHVVNKHNHAVVQP